QYFCITDNRSIIDVLGSTRPFPEIGFSRYFRCHFPALVIRGPSGEIAVNPVRIEGIVTDTGGTRVEVAAETILRSRKVTWCERHREDALCRCVWRREDIDEIVLKRMRHSR